MKRTPRHLYRRDGTPVAALEAALAVFRCEDLATLEHNVIAGTIALERVYTLRQGGTRQRPSGLAIHLMQLMKRRARETTRQARQPVA